MKSWVINQLLEVSEAKVFHSDLTDNSGVDFKFKEGRFLGFFLASKPKSSVDSIKGEDRGNRSIEKSASVALIVKKDSKYNKKS
jgi:hypothetical protein